MGKSVKSNSIPNATAEIRGVRYVLNKRTLHIQEKIDEIAESTFALGEKKISQKKYCKKLIEFVQLTTKCKDFNTPDITKIDLAELEVAVLNIIDAYNAQREDNREKAKNLKKLLEMGNKNV